MATHPCPICKEPAELDQSNPWRPFCSERCKLLDLGRWLDGDYVIPGPSAPQAQRREPEDDV